MVFVTQEVWHTGNLSELLRHVNSPSSRCFPLKSRILAASGKGKHLLFFLNCFLEYNLCNRVLMVTESLWAHSPVKPICFETMPVWEERCHALLTVLQVPIESIDLSMYFHFKGVFKKYSNFNWSLHRASSSEFVSGFQ